MKVAKTTSKAGHWFWSLRHTGSPLWSWTPTCNCIDSASELLWGVQFLGRAGVVRYRSLTLGRLVAVPRGAGEAGHVPRRQHSDDSDAQSATAPGLSGRHQPGATLCASSAEAGDGVRSARGRM
jgi:hypothetical protein